MAFSPQTSSNLTKNRVISIKIGDRAHHIAALTGLDVHTIAKGRSELLAHDVRLERIRRPGAGRPRLEKKHHKSSTRSKS